MSALVELPAALSRVVNDIIRPSQSEPQYLNGKENTDHCGAELTDGLRRDVKRTKPTSGCSVAKVSSDTADGGSPTNTVSDQASTAFDQSFNNDKDTKSAVSFDSNEAVSTTMSQSNATNGAIATHVNSINSEMPSDNPQYVDQFDTENTGDVVKYFFTADTRHRPLSPVQEHNCINVQFHDESDLFIKAKGTDGTFYVFEVHSGMLAASSPVFNEMVYATHTRGNKEEWIWELEESPIGLRAMFSILHHNVQAAMFIYNPRPSQVFDVLAVLDKYGVSDRAFHPWAKAWTDVFRKNDSETAMNDHELLYVACKLGDFKLFKTHVRRVAQQMELVDGTMFLQGKALQEVISVSDRVVEAIKNVRANELELLLNVFKEAYDFLIDESKIDEPRFCKSVDSHVDCHQKLLGSLLSHLVRKHLYPFASLVGFKGSVRKLAEDMMAMEIRGLYLPGLEPHKQRHGQCRLDLEDTVQKATSCEVHLPLSDAMLEEIYLTSKRVGTFRIDKAEFAAYKEQMDDILLFHRPEFSFHVRGWRDQAGDTDMESLFGNDEEPLPLDDKI